MKKSGKTNEPQSAVALEPLTDARRHTECFAQGAKLFARGEFAQAREIFVWASQGPVLSVNESALMYRRMCDQRLNRQRLEFATPEQQYGHAIGLLKQRQFTEALPVLESMLRSEDSARVRYALTLACGHIGDAGAASRHFKRACDQDPGLRVTARNDADFQPLLQFPELREALVEKA
ncbi:MAG: HEAT repeat domain-containing protein [Bryobacteraceae bacterium]